MSIQKHQSFKAISKVLDDHATAFEEKPDIQAARDGFVANTNRIGDILSQLMRPVATVISQKQDSESRLRKEMSKMTGIGLTLAAAQDNQPVVEALRNYDQQRKRCSAYQLYENAMHVSELLLKLQETGSTNGLTPEKITAFGTIVSQYGDTLDSTGFNLTDRRRSRSELMQLIKDNNKILRLQLDTFVRYLEDENHEFYTEYMFLRKRRTKRTRRKEPGEETIEISGTVTDSATGQPLANVSLDIAALELITTTDADGVYLFDELPEGSFVLSCHAEGYKVPAAVPLEVKNGDSLVLDFALEPEAEAEAAA